MKKKDIEAIVKYRLEEAEEALKDANILFESGGGLRSVINRSYYTMFYATLALIAQKGSGGSKHTGVISIFDREYVRNEIFPKGMSKTLHKAFNLRQESDYKEFIIITREDAQKVKDGAEAFLGKIKNYLEMTDD